MRKTSIFLLLLAITGAFACLGCDKIEGPSFPYVASPRAIVHTPASPAEGNIAISFQLIDREVEPADVTVEYSTNGGQTYNTATLTIPGDAANLASAWYPGKTHTVTWDSVTDMVGRSGAVRFKGQKSYTNARMSVRQIRKHCSIDKEGESLLKAAVTTLGLSARAYHRILKVARTIADIETCDEIAARHVSEAVSYRILDREIY
jgi:hypothetical protein